VSSICAKSAVRHQRNQTSQPPLPGSVRRRPGCRAKLDVENNGRVVRSAVGILYIPTDRRGTSRVNYTPLPCGLPTGAGCGDCAEGRYMRPGVSVQMARRVTGELWKELDRQLVQGNQRRLVSSSFPRGNENRLLCWLNFLSDVE